ncbi:MAG: phosphotransferase family protein [Acidimicrobiia bacterium]
MALADPERLEPWLDAQGLAPGAPLVVEELGGGGSNAMFRITRGDESWVLRRPRRVAIEKADEGMRREYRILRALEGTPVPHATPVVLCDDHDVLGCTFYLMTVVDGVDAFPAPPALDDDTGRAALAYALVDALASLHNVDWQAAGLADLGRPDGFHERQVSRWSGQLATYRNRDLPGIDDVMTWLDAHRPSHFTPTTMHADYHMRNVMIATDPPARVLAIVDWETATIGDPLLDLAGFCEAWCGAASVEAGWPSRDALISRYREARGLAELPDLRYYEVLYNFRLCVLLEGVYQRSLQDPDAPVQQMLGDRALVNLARAVELTS